ncbi:PREDICTED: probable protein arginine N-methyltransferase 3 [Fragaria vesca subsp. vesca]|uniref:probable protein arginine N-methyltransferase 3 n=1 Tax=Fragaria vesca subsp. vesca TaxID=101020 RepID=UPI0002C2FE56|nr:PREDICTED: probable protein arginine N-methyltransferase 3 [Fragaria vesca subsp. vesca]
MADHTEHDPTLTDDEYEVDELQDWDDWNADEADEQEESSDLDSELLCLFCDSKFTYCDELFDHCSATHHFDFRAIRNALGLSFYSSFKLINYVRSQVFDCRCWSCGQRCQSSKDLLNHLHETVDLKDIKPIWDSDVFLKPFLADDAVLYSFGEDEEGDDEYNVAVDKDELMSDLRHFEEICIDHQIHVEKIASDSDNCCESGKKDGDLLSNGCLNTASSSGMVTANGVNSGEYVGSSERKTKGKSIRTYVPNHGSKDMKNVNDDYFASYSSFVIHREMLNDKVRMDAYGQAILKNPSLLKSAVVMDVGCGTGILSLFAAQAGASKVIAVEASEKMASVATRIAKDNDLLLKSSVDSTTHGTGVIEVVQGMVEELDKSMVIQPHSVDVLLSEWMGYCLLYEAMLSSVLFARDKWLKPGGAMLPDTATIFVAGFGKGATSLPFWESVYGFNMSCVGKELVDGAAKVPIVDVVEDHGLVTSAAILQTFDLVTMKPDEVDFTASVVLEPNCDGATSGSNGLKSETTWCYGIVLWFETGFTSRFCKEKPAVLSTSPYTPPTHWMQTILTFPEPIAVTSGKSCVDRSAAVGTEVCPAARIQLRISIARASQHRNIDISLETTGIDLHGRKHSWPVQLFNLT